MNEISPPGVLHGVIIQHFCQVVCNFRLPSSRGSRGVECGQIIIIFKSLSNMPRERIAEVWSWYIMVDCLAAKAHGEPVGTSLCGGRVQDRVRSTYRTTEKAPC